MHHLLSAASRFTRPYTEMASRLAALGFDVDPRAPSQAELTLISRNIDGNPPLFIDSVPVRHVVHLAERLGEPAAVVATRLAELAPVFGFRLGFDPDAVGAISDADWTLLSRDVDGVGPFLDGRIPLPHVVKAAARLGLPPAAITARLFEGALAALRPLSEPLPWPACDLRACLAAYSASLATLVWDLREASYPRAQLVRATGRRHLWWLTEDALDRWEREAAAFVELAFD